MEETDTGKRWFICELCGARLPNRKRDSHNCKPTRRPALLPDCVHRGPLVDWRDCDICGRRGDREPVFRCGVFGICTRTKYKTGPQAERDCLRCDRAVAHGVARFLTVADLVRDSLALAAQIPPDVAAIAGVPRSGMIAAAALAACLHLPLLVAPDLRAVGGGGRAGRLEYRGGRVLVVDDSVGVGHQAAKLRRELPAGVSYLLAAVYANPAFAGDVDLVAVELAPHHLFEWNLANSPALAGQVAWDFDGVIVADRDQREPTAWRPRLAPIDIISGRPEGARALTLDTCRRLGIRVGSLTLSPFATMDEAIAAEFDFGRFKGEQYAARPRLVVFVESDRGQAKTIAAVSGKPVICATTNEFFPGGS